jgi:hypothetical protein
MRSLPRFPPARFSVIRKPETCLASYDPFLYRWNSRSGFMEIFSRMLSHLPQPLLILRLFEKTANRSFRGIETLVNLRINNLSYNIFSKYPFPILPVKKSITPRIFEYFIVVFFPFTQNSRFIISFNIPLLSFNL